MLSSNKNRTSSRHRGRRGQLPTPVHVIILGGQGPRSGGCGELSPASVLEVSCVIFENLVNRVCLCLPSSPSSFSGFACSTICDLPQVRTLSSLPQPLTLPTPTPPAPFRSPKVVDAGMRVMRINFSHATFEEAEMRLANLRAVSRASTSRH